MKIFTYMMCVSISKKIEKKVKLGEKTFFHSEKNNLF